MITTFSTLEKIRHELDLNKGQFSARLGFSRSTYSKALKAAKSLDVEIPQTWAGAVNSAFSNYLFLEKFLGKDATFKLNVVGHELKGSPISQVEKIKRQLLGDIVYSEGVDLAAHRIVLTDKVLVKILSCLRGVA